MRAPFLALVMFLFAPPALAQSSPVVAEALFQEGKKLMAEGRYAEACPKLAESNRLDRGAGALTALALCHKAEGKTASAWSEFKEVISLARRDGRKDREQVALENVAELEPKLSRLRLDVSAAALEQGVEVLLDDTPVPRAVFGQSFPTDPGDHRIVAVRDGKKPFESIVTVASERDEQTVAVPALADDDNALLRATLPKASAAAPAAEPPSTRRIVGYALGGLGVGSLTVGAAFGIRAIAKADESDALCGDPCADPRGLKANEEARSAATVSNVALVTGLVAVTAGVVLILTAPPGRSAARWRAAPKFGKRGASFELGASF